MAIRHRKLLEEIYSYGKLEVKEETTFCYRACEDCPEACGDFEQNFVPPSVTHKSTNHHYMATIFTVTLCVFGGAFLLLFYFIILRRRSNRTRVRNPTLNNTVGEDFMDENQGPVLDHPIWYINTVGLQQSVIDSIAVFRYRRDERLIEGSDCSVCLSEFQEDESLRLLPKCSHAFHISCIDTWLRSHKNCPLCRAPIVSDASNSSNELGPREESQRVNIENDNGVVGQQIREDGNDEMSVFPNENTGSQPVQDERVTKILESNLRMINSRIGEGRVLSDLASHQVTIKDESQPVRRSFSVDLSSASLVHLAVANSQAVQNDGCSSTQVKVQEKIPEFMAKKGKKNSNSNSSMDDWITSSSLRWSLRKKPISMKRSFSCGGNCFVPGTISTSPDSISHL